MANTQRMSQATQGGSRPTIGEYARQLNNQAELLKEGSCSQGERERLTRALSALCDNDFQRLVKMFQFLKVGSEKDKSKFLAESAEHWLFLLGELTPHNSLGRRFYLSLLLEHLVSPHVSLPAFVTIYNIFVEQTEKMSFQDLMYLCESVSLKVDDINCSVSSRWKDCVVIIVKRLLEVSTISDDKSVSGASVTLSLLSSWLNTCKNNELFGHIMAIAECCEASQVVRSFIHGEMQIAMDSADKLSEEDKGMWSLRILQVMEKEDIEKEKGMRMQLLKALVFIWEGQYGDGKTPSTALNEPIVLLNKYLHSHTVIGKQLLSLIKMERSRIFSSQFAFASMISLIGVDRHKTAALTELKRAICQVFKMEEECGIGWLKKGLPSLSRQLNSQMEMITSRLSTHPFFSLLSKPFLHFCYSLLDTQQSTIALTICDNRIVSGPRCWMFASKTIRAVMAAKPSNISISSVLPQLIEAICSSTCSNSALVLIDILVGVVKQYTADILNNSSLFEMVPKYASRMRRDIGLSLIRSLIPILHQRVFLRENLVCVLEKDIGVDMRVCSSVSLLLLLLHSLLPSSNSSECSQSFATFSSQSLCAMGCVPNRDSSLLMRIVSCLRRCLSQPLHIRSTLYRGFVEASTRNPSVAEKCLDLLIGHTSSLPEWSTEQMIISTDSIVQLKESIPILLHALNSLSHCVIISSSVMDNDSQSGDSLVDKANGILNEWTKKAVNWDMEDLGLDKLADWNVTTRTGRATILFAHSTIALYDVLIEFIWTKLNVLEEKNEIEHMNILMRRRKEVMTVLSENVKKKEKKARTQSDVITVDTSECEVQVSISCLSSMVDTLIGAEVMDSLDGLSLLQWTLEKTCITSEYLNSQTNCINKERISTIDVITISRRLLQLYRGEGCAQWLTSIESCHPLKRLSLQSYTSLIQWLLTRQSNRMEKIATIWQSEEEWKGAKRAIMKHISLVTARILPGLIILDKEGEEKKEDKVEMEKQTKLLVKVVECLVDETDNPNAPNATFNLIKSLLHDATPRNAKIISDILGLLQVCSLKCVQFDEVGKYLLKIALQVVHSLTGEVMEDTPDWISPLTTSAVVDFLVSITDSSLNSIRSSLTFIGYFGSEVDEMDSCLCGIMSGCEWTSRLISTILPIHTQLNMYKDKITNVLIPFFSTMDLLFKTVQETVTRNGLFQYKCIDPLAQVVELLDKLLIDVDEHVGVTGPEDEGKTKNKYAKTKKEGGVYVRFVKAREGVQSRVLILSKTLNDSRFDLQVKNNSIGLRDFKIDQNILSESIKRAANEMDDNLGGEGDTQMKKKRRRNDEMDGDDIENDPSRHASPLI